MSRWVDGVKPSYSKGFGAFWALRVGLSTSCGCGLRRCKPQAAARPGACRETVHLTIHKHRYYLTFEEVYDRVQSSYKYLIA
jgi:hypothetical protein